MKWISHKLLTASLIYAITGNPIPTIAATAGSILPDAIEGFPNESNQATWRRHHRKFSHWFIPYLIALIVFYTYAYLNGIQNLTLSHLSFHTLQQTQSYPQIAYFLSFISIGAILHILQDAICGKVPLWNPNKQEFGTKLFYVGSVKEYIYVLPISFLLIFIKIEI